MISARRTPSLLAVEGPPFVAVTLDVRRFRLAVSGELDVATTPLLADAATLLLAAAEPASWDALRIRLQGVTYLDSAALNAFVHIAGLLPSGCRLALDDVPTGLRRPFSVCGLGHLLADPTRVTVPARRLTAGAGPSMGGRRRVGGRRRMPSVAVDIAMRRAERGV